MLKWIVRCAILAIGFILIVVVVNMNLPKGQAKTYTILPAVGLFMVWYCAEWLFTKKRLKEVRARLGELGFEQSQHADLHYEPERKHRGFQVRYSMAADWRGLPVRVAEYEYTTGAGKSSQTHHFFEARVPLDRDWPAFRLEYRKGFLGRPVLQLFSAPKLAAEFGEFGKNAEVVADDPELIARLMGPDLREWLAGRSSKETWCLKDGELSCTWKGACEVRDVESVLGRLAMFLAKAPT